MSALSRQSASWAHGLGADAMRRSLTSSVDPVDACPFRPETVHAAVWYIGWLGHPLYR